MIAALWSPLGRSVAALVLAALPFVAHAESKAAPPNAPAGFSADREKPGFELVKEWDFSASSRKLPALLDDFYTLYAFDNGRQDYLPGTGEWQRYRLNRNHVLEDGTLKLVARAVNGWAPGGFESGMIRSKLSQRYGYFEVSAKMPSGRGLWPSITLQPADAVWPPSIVVATTVGNRPGALHTSYHLLAGKSVGPDRDSKVDQWGGYENSADLTQGYHVFAVDWTPQGVTHYVDGVVVVKRNFAWKHDDGSDAGPAQLVVSLAVGGNWAGPPTDAADFPAAMAIKYIRVYRHVSNQLVELPAK
jgi:beta-glucanase (GH16 family)